MQVTLQFEVEDEKLEALLAIVASASAASRQSEESRQPKQSRRSARIEREFKEGTPEWEGNYARLYREHLRADLWEMVYEAASNFGTQPFTLGQLAEALNVPAEEVRKRLQAIGRSRVVADILAAVGGVGFEGNTRDDAMPWLRYRDESGR